MSSKQSLTMTTQTTGLQNTAIFEQRTRASIKIQSFWRGHVVRRKYPKLSDPCQAKNTLCYAIGNDPISFAEHHIRFKKKPAILATGGVQCLHNAIRLTQQKDVSLGHKPMIFLMDFSGDMKQLWVLLKDSFMRSSDINEFLGKLPSVTPDRSAEHPQWQKLNRKLIIRSHDEEHRKSVFRNQGLNPDKFHSYKLRVFFETLFNNEKNRFEWVKSLVLNHLIFIMNDWISCPQVFKTIKAVCDYHNYDIVVYASNIHETPSTETHVNTKLWNNILLLSPVMTIKTISKPFPGGFLPIGTEYLIGQRLRCIREVWTYNTRHGGIDHHSDNLATRHTFPCCSIQ